MEREYDEDTEYEYKMSREYNWNVKSKANKGYEENYFVDVVILGDAFSKFKMKSVNKYT